MPGYEDGEDWLDRLELRLLARIEQNQEILMSAISDLTAAVTAETTIDQGVVTLLEGLSADLTAAIQANDMTAVAAATATMTANAQSLAAAIVANTPAAAAPMPVAPDPTPVAPPATLS